MDDFPSPREYVDTMSQAYNFWRMDPANYDRPMSSFVDQARYTYKTARAAFEFSKQPYASVQRYKDRQKVRDATYRAPEIAPNQSQNEPVRPQLPSKAELFASGEATRVAMRNA